MSDRVQVLDQALWAVVPWGFPKIYRIDFGGNEEQQFLLDSCSNPDAELAWIGGISLIEGRPCVLDCMNRSVAVFESVLDKPRDFLRLVSVVPLAGCAEEAERLATMADDALVICADGGDTLVTVTFPQDQEPRTATRHGAGKIGPISSFWLCSDGLFSISAISGTCQKLRSLSSGTWQAYELENIVRPFAGTADASGVPVVLGKDNGGHWFLQHGPETRSLDELVRDDEDPVGLACCGEDKYGILLDTDEPVSSMLLLGYRPGQGIPVMTARVELGFQDGAGPHEQIVR